MFLVISHLNIKIVSFRPIFRLGIPFFLLCWAKGLILNMETKKLVPLFIMALFSLDMYSQRAEVETGNLEKSIDEYLSRTVPFGFSGAVLVAREGEIILNKGYGYADRKQMIENSPANVFLTGSVTKQFTAAAIMKLEMMGKLNTEDKLSQYFVNLPKDKEAILLKHLLTHTSGLPLAFSEDDFESISREVYVKQAWAAELEFPPGTEFNYSNVGYTLLAIIIENLSGLTYEEFLQKHLFRPAGMARTGYRLPNWKKENFVHLYRDDRDNGTSEYKAEPTWHLKGNGGILSTTDDMFRWIHALKGNSILSGEAKKKMFTPFRNDYGFGWDILDDGNLRQHNGGGSRGNGAELRWFVADDMMTIVFTNATIDGKPGFAIVRNELEALTTGDEVIMPPKISPVSTDLKPLEGTYEFPSGEQFNIKVNGEEAKLIVESQEVLDLLVDPKNYTPDGPNVQQNKKFGAAFSKALKTGDYSGFDFTGAADDLKKEIRNELKMEGITNPHFKVLRTIPSQRAKGTNITKVALNRDENFQGESLMLSIVTENQKYAGLGVDFGFAGPLELTMLPLGSNKFQLYGLESKIGAEIDLKENSNGSYELSIGNKTIILKRVDL